jgi:hypothetical protein
MIQMNFLHRLSAVSAICLTGIVVTSCGTSPAPGESPPLIEQQTAQTFLENHHALKKTTAYRQNIWITWGEDSYPIALCVDLKNRVYLVVSAASKVQKKTKLPEFYQNLSVSVPALRARMDPDAFVLNEAVRPIFAIIRIPEDPPESFVADSINQLLGTHITPESLTFQAD